MHFCTAKISGQKMHRNHLIPLGRERERISNQFKGLAKSEAYDGLLLLVFT